LQIFGTWGHYEIAECEAIPPRIEVTQRKSRMGKIIPIRLFLFTAEIAESAEKNK
jgi:hypothetical protein